MPDAAWTNKADCLDKLTCSSKLLFSKLNILALRLTIAKMKTHIFINSIFISSLYALRTSALPKFNVQQQLLIPQDIVVGNTDLGIPGDSPANHCADPRNDLFHIERLDVLPNPPQRYVQIIICLRDRLPAVFQRLLIQSSGQSCIIEIEGIFRQSVEEDPMFMLNATYNSMKSIDTVEKLCDHVDIVQHQALVCPPRQGRALLSYSFFIHELMTPPVWILTPGSPLMANAWKGNYTQRIDAYTHRQERLFCLTSAVNF